MQKKEAFKLHLIIIEFQDLKIDIGLKKGRINAGY